MRVLVGVDEVGRGSWAGPLLVVAAKAITVLPNGLKDSKTLTKKKRESLVEALTTSCQFGEGWVQPEEIDAHGLSKSLRIGVQRALLALGTGLMDEIILDGNVNYCPPEFTNARCEIKADSLYPIVSAASIYAKVLRDQHMVRLARFHPYYGFEQHVGYGTAQHRSSLKIHGVSKVHRKSYKPVQAYI